MAAHDRRDTLDNSDEEIDWALLHRVALGFACFWCKNRDDAHDVAQEAIAALVTRRDAVRKPLPWLFVATRRAATRLARREGQRRQSEQVWLDAPPSIRRETAPDTIIDVTLHQSLLSASQKRLLLYHGFGYTHAEIARRLGCSRHDVGSLLARVMKRPHNPDFRRS